MSYTFFSHTGDVGLRVTAGSLGELFADAALALADLLTDPAAICPRDEVHVALAAPDVDMLLVDWLNELIYRHDAEAWLVARAEVDVARDAGAVALRATVKGERQDARRHPARLLVKAATYHALEVRQDDSGWVATVVLDV